MTVIDIYRECGLIGGMPFVTPDKGKTVGRVTVIKENESHKGIAVRYPNMSYDVWYHDSPDTDRRSKYMREIEIVGKTPTE